MHMMKPPPLRLPIYYKIFLPTLISIHVRATRDQIFRTVKPTGYPLARNDLFEDTSTYYPA